MLSPGTRIGPYEVIEPLGAGGMGEVYRARDARLKRDVALKILPDSLATDADRLARMEREAQVLASLNHPHIAAIHGVEESNGTRALVLELVEGETLADRIARGPIPVAEALPIARQIAEALAAAHDHGVIHRDIKPANIKITLDDRVKVLDFGLAKLADPIERAGGRDQSLSPTITSPVLTGVGVLLGTGAYMSPEQAKGRAADKRSDVWAFGCVLFEMLTGARAFEGDDISETIASVLKSPPALQHLPPDTPSRIRTLIERCLQKDVRRRLPDIAEARIQIEDALTNPDPAPQAAAVGIQRPRRWLWPVLVAVPTTVAAALAAWMALAPTRSPDVVSFDIEPPAGVRRSTIEGGLVSPDGRTVALTMVTDGERFISIRAMDGPTIRPLEGTQGATRPQFSHDSKSIAFFVGDQLKKVALAGGPPQVVAHVSGGRDIAWGPGNVILLGGLAKEIQRVSSDGVLRPATRLGPGETTHDYPAILPDGRHFTYLARRGGGPQDWDAYVTELDSDERTLLPRIHAGVKYSPSGHLIFIHDSVLMGQRFDADRLELSGEIFAIADGMRDGPARSFSLSDTGTFVQLRPISLPISELTGSIATESRGVRWRRPASTRELICPRTTGSLPSSVGSTCSSTTSNGI
jgi:hypothetical protein